MKRIFQRFSFLNTNSSRYIWLVAGILWIGIRPLQAQVLSVASNITVNEGDGVANFTVNLSSASAGTVTVNYATSNSLAVAPGDYISASGSLTFLPGELSKTVPVTIVNDYLQEPNETFNFTISSPVGATIGTSSRNCTIVNDDPVLNLAANGTTIVESAGTQTYTITLSAVQTYTVSVNYATSNLNAVAGSDYVATSGTVTFLPGETSKTISVTIINDYLFESSSDNFRMSISGAQNVNASMPMSIGTSFADVLITNDDPQFSISVVSPVIESVGNAQFTITLSAAQSYTATIDYATQNLNATAGVDYTATTGTATFLPGETTKVILVPIVNDYLFESSSDNFRLNILNAQNQTATMPMSMSNTFADVQITNDDPQFSISVVSPVIESAGNAQFTITLSAAQSYTATIDYATQNLNATAGVDYTATTGTATFLPGETTKVIQVPIVNDYLFESSSDNFRLNILNAQNQTAAMPMSIGTAFADVLITNDDPQFSISVASPLLESVGNAQFTITLSAAQSYTATIDYATQSLNAIAGADYTTTSGTATFLPGETSKVILVPIVNDYLFESSSDNFRLNISNAQNQTASMPMSIGTAFADVLITNDDPQFSISAASPVLESVGNAQFTITLSAAQSYTATIDYATQSLNAIAGADYTTTSGTATFLPGETSKVILVPILNDYLIESSSDNFRMNISNAQNQTASMPMSIGTAFADVLITNDDPQFSISVVSPVIESAGNAQFTITLSFAQSYTATIDYATQSLNAVAGTDYTSTSGTATFLPGETTKVILVPILNDYLFESSSDNFRLNISNAQNQTASMPMSIGTNFADVLISNDDPQISITSPSAITEAFTYQNFTVTLSAAQTYPVGVDYVAVGLSAMPGFDFTFSSCTQSLTFNPGETTKTIPIRILDDGYTEPNESYQVQLSNARNLNVNMPMSFLQSTANGTINDNDGAGCGSTILSLPVISGTTLYCPGTTLNLSVAAVPGATGYSWKGPNGYSASGTSISIPSVSATHSGIYTVRAYRPGGTVCDTSVGVSVNVAVVPCASTVSAKAYIEGYYLDSGKMAPVLFNHGEIDNTTITDSVYVDLHADTPPYTLVSTQKVALFTNGTILVTFPGITGSYYLAIRHSSAVETWSAVPVVLSAVPAVYDFSNALNKAFGDNLVQVDPGIYAFYNGDINQDQNIDLIDLSEMEIRIANFETCFLPTDLNGDGNTDLLDSPLLENNISLFVFSNHP